MSRRQRQRRRRRQLRPDIAQLAVEPILVRRPPPSAARGPAPPVRRQAQATGDRRRRGRDDSTVGAEVGGRASAGRGVEQTGVGDVDDVAMRHRVTLYLPQRRQPPTAAWRSDLAAFVA